MISFMKQLTVSILLMPFWFSTFAQPATARRQLADVMHYLFNVHITDDNNIIRGEATIKVRFLKSCSSLQIDLAGRDSSGKGMVVSTVKSKGKMLNFKHIGNKLHISVSATAGETKSFTIQYAGIPADGLIMAKNRYGRRTVFADNWPDRAHNWIPCLDDPADKSAVEFVVTAPKHYQVISNGVKISENILQDNTRRTHWKEVIPLPTKVMVIGVAEFAVNHAGDVGGIPVYSWVYPEDRKNGFYDYSLAVDILPWFIKNIGPYPYRKLVNVQSTTRFGGMENASAIFYSEYSIKGDRTVEPLLAHEIAHQWFGNSLTEKNWSDIWLSEGFATYLTRLYLESKYGPDTLLKQMKTDRDSVIAYAKKRNLPVIDTTVTDSLMRLLNINSYQKGGWVLHMLRIELGDLLFWEGIRKFYNSFKGKNASSDDFQKTMEQVSGQNLNPFFRQWLYTPGQPDLKVTWEFDHPRKVAVITVFQQQQTLFSFPLKIQLTAGSHRASETIRVIDQKTVMEISFPLEPDRIVPDPEVHVLFSSQTEKIRQAER